MSTAADRVRVSSVLMAVCLTLAACQESMSTQPTPTIPQKLSPMLVMKERAREFACASRLSSGAIEYFGTNIGTRESSDGISDFYSAPTKPYVLIRDARLKNEKSGETVELTCIVPQGLVGSRFFAEAMKHAGAKLGDATTVKRVERSSTARDNSLFDSLAAKTNSAERRYSAVPKEVGSISLPSIGSGNSLERTASNPGTLRTATLNYPIATVYVHAVANSYAINLADLITLTETSISQIKLVAMLGEDFCDDYDQATTVANLALSDLANETTFLNDALSAADSVLNSAICECAVGRPSECLDFWIEPSRVDNLLGDGRGPDSLATLTRSRAHIYFDVTDPTKTELRINTTTKTNSFRQLTTFPIDTTKNWVKTTQVGDTIKLQWHLTNGACASQIGDPCVAISGNGKFVKHPNGTITYQIERDAFPSMAYYRKGPSGCTFSGVFYEPPRHILFNLDFIQLIPIFPNQILKGPEENHPACQEQ